MADAVQDGVDRGRATPVLGGEVVEHQLVDDQVLEGQAGVDGIDRRPWPADDDPAFSSGPRM